MENILVDHRLSGAFHPNFTLSMEQQYLRLLAFLHTKALRGQSRSDRTGVGTYSTFGAELRCNLQEDIGILSSKYVSWKTAFVELCWILKGHTNIQYLKDHDVSIWDEWADEKGELGPVYGAQWRKPNPQNPDVDPLKTMMCELKTHPNSRRHVISAWNPNYIPLAKHDVKQARDSGCMALAPCHYSFQVYIDDEDRVNLKLIQRSADVFLGLPFNIIGYSMLTKLIATHLDREVGDLIISLGDVHLYTNHIDQAYEQLKNNTDPSAKRPEMIITSKKENLWDYEPGDLQISNYRGAKRISAPVAV